MKKFWNWTNNTESPERTLHLNGTIAEECWFDDDVTPKLFEDELCSGSGDVTVWINSPGGDCVAAAQIYNMLKEYNGNITVKIDGIAASAASVIAMAGDTVLMSPVSMLMIHNPATLAFGDAAEMKKAVEMLDEVKESIINAYELKTGLSRAKIAHLMDNETWMNAYKAKQMGFADGILYRDADEKDDEEEEEIEVGTEETTEPEEETEPESPEEESEEDKPKEEKKTAPGANAKPQAVLFSKKTADNAFMKKLSAHCKTAPVNTKESKQTGRSVSELMERLSLLKR